MPAGWLLVGRTGRLPSDRTVPSCAIADDANACPAHATRGRPTQPAADADADTSRSISPGFTGG